MELAKGTLDARGRVLQEGDEVILVPQGPIFFRVVRVVPAMDPKLPPGLLQIDFAALVPWMAQRGKVNPEFIRVRTAEEAGPMKGMRTVEGPETTLGAALQPPPDGQSER